MHWLGKLREGPSLLLHQLSGPPIPSGLWNTKHLRPDFPGQQMDPLFLRSGFRTAITAEIILFRGPQQKHHGLHHCPCVGSLLAGNRLLLLQNPDGWTDSLGLLDDDFGVLFGSVAEPAPEVLLLHLLRHGRPVHIQIHHSGGPNFFRAHQRCPCLTLDYTNHCDMSLQGEEGQSSHTLSGGELYGQLLLLVHVQLVPELLRIDSTD